MTTASTTLLGLALPVTGELSGTWGDVVNASLTNLLDTAIAGTTTLSSDADVTLTTTTLSANQARQAVILWTAGGTATRTITAPAQSKSYVVINATSSSQSIKLVGVGPTTGITIVAGEKCFAAWNGSDFVKIGNTSGAGVFSTVTASSLTSGRVTYAGTAGLLQDSANLTFNGTTLTANTIGAFTLGGTVAGGGNQLNNVVIGTTTPLAGAFTTLSATSDLTLSNGSGAILMTGISGGAISITQNAAAYLQSNNSVVLRGYAPNYYSYLNASNTGTTIYDSNGTTRAAFSSTGLAVTGALSATGTSALQKIGVLVANGFYGDTSAITIGMTGLTQSIYSNVNGTGTDRHITLNNGGSVNAFIGTSGSTKLQLGINATSVLDVTSTGLAVTGTLSATGTSALQKIGVLVANGFYGDTSAITIGMTGLTQSIYSNVNGTGTDRHITLNNGGSVNAFIGTSGSTKLQLGINATSVLDVTSTGLAVTGALSATGVISSSGSSASQLNISSSVTGNVVAVISSTGTSGGNYGLQLNAGTTATDYGLRVRQAVTATSLFTVAGDGAAIAYTSVGVGNTTPSGGGAGIAFPATQSASSDANTLDDYEEGTWTPNQGAGLTVVGTFSSVGSYTKIGRMVYVSGGVKSTSTVSFSAVGVVCSNLPFTAITSPQQPGSGAMSSSTSGPSSLAYSSSVYATASGSGADGYFFNIAYQI